MQNSSGSKARRKTVGYRNGLSWSEDIQTQWQPVFGSNWTKATEGAPWEDGGGPWNDVYQDTGDSSWVRQLLVF